MTCIQVNDKKIELHTVANTVSPSHTVKLAGFKLPEKPAQQPTPEISKQGSFDLNWFMRYVLIHTIRNAQSNACSRNDNT